ncbi:MAG: hypothetical protein OES47_07835 [Acidobacteriota bacterium]|nr:hypothetical protein [Acidobacteriota bacterium]
MSALWLSVGVAQAADDRNLTPRRTLFLTLDAVPFSLLAELTSAARGDDRMFGDFQPPVPLISTFPSTTTIALGEAFESAGLRRAPGYEARFFDRRLGKVRGGGVLSYFRIDFPWRRFFDWSSKGAVRSALAGARPVRVSGKRVVRSVEEFLAGEEREFFAYVDTTDLASHLRSPAALEPALRRLDRALTEARLRHPTSDFRVVVLSDHGIAGGEPLDNVWPEIKRRLGEAGYRYAKRLRRPTDIAFVPFGLVSSLEAYTEEEQTPRVAELLASVGGVEACVYRLDKSSVRDQGWRIAGAQGVADVYRRQRAFGSEWAYRMLSADPLGYAEVVEGLRNPTGEKGEEWFSDRSWFEASNRHRLPDAPYRIARAFELVDNPASVICSLEPGYMFGSRATERTARFTKGRLEWTHGALHWEASAGFLMSDDPEWKPEGPVRIGRALEPFLDTKSARNVAKTSE